MACFVFRPIAVKGDGMKRLAICFLCLSGMGLVGFVDSVANAACGEVIVSKGDVKIESGKTKKVESAPEGTKICSGDTISTAPQSRAKIKMEDGNELNISPDSKIALEQYEFKPEDNKKKVLLNVLSGKVRAATAKEGMYNDQAKDGQANTFQVRTKSAVAGVRGTDFLTGYNPANNKSEVVTFRGKVEFGQLGPGGQILNPVQVGAGQKTELLRGQPPAPPKAVPKADLEKMSTDTKADTTSSGKETGNTQASADKKDDRDKKDTDKKDASADKKEASAERKEAATDKKESGPEKKEAAVDKKEASSASTADNGKGGGPADSRGGEKSDGPKNATASNEGGKQANTNSGGEGAKSVGAGNSGSSAGGSSATAANGPAPVAPTTSTAATSGGETRAPAAIGPAPAAIGPATGLLNSNDLAKGPAAGPIVSASGPALPTVYVPPTANQVPTTPTTNTDFINNIRKNTNVNVRITLPK